MWDIGGLSNHVFLTYHFHLVSAHLRAADVSNLTQGGGLYNDYAVLALYDGAQLLLAVLLVILGGGLAVQLSLFWWLGSKSLLVLSVSGFNCAAYTLLCALSSLTVFIQSAAPFSGGCWLLV